MKRQMIKLTLEFELVLETPDVSDNWEEWEWLEAIENFNSEDAINRGIYQPIYSQNTGTLEAHEVRRSISGIGYEAMKNFRSHQPTGRLGE